jgi:hypothetical protein
LSSFEKRNLLSNIHNYLHYLTYFIIYDIVGFEIILNNGI